MKLELTIAFSMQLFVLISNIMTPSPLLFTKQPTNQPEAGSRKVQVGYPHYLYLLQVRVPTTVLLFYILSLYDGCVRVPGTSYCTEQSLSE